MYTIQLDNNSINAINFVGYRYMWSDILSTYEPTVNDDGSMQIELSEADAFILHDAILNDDSGFLPCLSPNSLLYQELYNFINSVV